VLSRRQTARPHNRARWEVAARPDCSQAAAARAPRRAPCAFHTQGGTGSYGLRGGCVCSAAGRCEVPLALAGGCCMHLAPALIALFSSQLARARRAPASRHPTPHKPIRGIRARMSSGGRGLRICIASSKNFLKTDSPSRFAFLFGGTLCGNNGPTGIFLFSPSRPKAWARDTSEPGERHNGTHAVFKCRHGGVEVGREGHKSDGWDGHRGAWGGGGRRSCEALLQTHKADIAASWKSQLSPQCSNAASSTVGDMTF